MLKNHNCKCTLAVSSLSLHLKSFDVNSGKILHKKMSYLLRNNGIIAVH